MMICPVCENEEATLFAEIKPDGWIGCFCKSCLKIYVTYGSDENWRTYCDVEEARQDIIGMFNVDIEKEIIDLVTYELNRGNGPVNIMEEVW
ncbi:MAG: hypothetical protein GF411_08670 [Candidatus Lokiarchaeota archaeon]|nr:hypothetical protein [Candidatus Lokiarchaeota archaeon]